MADCVLLSDQITNWWFAAHYNNVEILILNFMFYKDTFLQQFFYQWKKFRHFSVNCVIIHEYLGGGSHRITISHSSVYILRPPLISLNIADPDISLDFFCEHWP